MDIGSYGVTYRKRSDFIFKTIQESKGFFIRRINWLRILNDSRYPELTPVVKKQIEASYIKNVETKLNDFRDKELIVLSKRADYDKILHLSVNSKK